MFRNFSKPVKRLVLLSLSLGMLSSCLVNQIHSPALAEGETTPNKPSPPAASGEIQKIRDEIQLQAMGEVADKISLVASDMYAEANKGNPNADRLDHPQKQAAKLVPGGITGSTDISWSDAAKPSNEWLEVFVSELNSWFPLFKEEMAAVLIPDDKQKAVEQDWNEIQADLTDAEDIHQQLRAMVKTSPPDGAKIAAATRNLYNKMQDLKSRGQDMYEILAATNTALEGAPVSWKAVSAGSAETSSSSADPQANENGSASGSPSEKQTPLLSGQVKQSEIGLRDLHEAAIKMERTSRDLIGELERWNLLWGQPPQNNESSGMLWGGGLTKEEVLSEYRTMPLTVFTSPSYVKFFSYRLPPRKKYLLIYTRQLGQQINMMARALNATDLPSDNQAGWSEPWSQIQVLSKDVASRYINLLNLVENTTDDRLKKSIRADQLTFGEPMAAIYSDVEKLGGLVKQVNENLKQPTKSAEKAS